jgi:DNA polymerase III delta subunit
MYQRDLDALLNKKEIPKSLALFGVSFYHIDLYLKKIIEILKPDDINVFYNFDYEFAKVRSALSGGSLFSNSTLVVLKSEENIKQNELKNLVSMANSSESNWFLYLHYGDNREIENSFDKFVRFFKPDDSEIFKIVSLETKTRKLFLDEQATIELIDRTDGEIYTIINELDKLKNLNKNNISKKDIEENVLIKGSFQTEDGIEIIPKFFETKNINTVINFIDKNNADYLDFFAFLNKFLWDIYLFKNAIHSNQNPINSMLVLGIKLPPKIENNRIELSKKISFKTISKILYFSMSAESQLKSGKYGNRESLSISILSEIEKLFK